MAYRLDAVREFVGPVQKVKGCKVVGAAVIIRSALAGSVHDAGVMPGRRLAGLNVDVIGMHRNLSRDSDSAHVGSKVICA